MAFERFKNYGMNPFETAMQEIKHKEDMLIVGGTFAIFAAIGCAAYFMMRKKDR